MQVIPDRQITGRVTKIGDVQTSSTGKSSWRTLVVETGDKWSNPIPVVFRKDDMAKLDAIRVGDDVTVGYKLQGREWNGRNFVDVTGLYIERSAAPRETPAAPQQSTEPEDFPF